MSFVYSASERRLRLRISEESVAGSGSRPALIVRGAQTLLEWIVNRIKLLNALFAYFECGDATLRCHKQYISSTPRPSGLICILIVQTEAEECSFRSLNEVINVIDGFGEADNRVWSMGQSDSFPIAKVSLQFGFQFMIYPAKKQFVSTRYILAVST